MRRCRDPARRRLAQNRVDNAIRYNLPEHGWIMPTAHEASACTSTSRTISRSVRAKRKPYGGRGTTHRSRAGIFAVEADRGRGTS